MFIGCLLILWQEWKDNYEVKINKRVERQASTATTLLCLSTVNQLRQSQAIVETSRKILSFTDNRQDASLQAGHFNDFVQTSLLRIALYQALQTHGNLNHETLTQAVLQHLNLTQQDYAQDRKSTRLNSSH